MTRTHSQRKINFLKKYFYLTSVNKTKAFEGFSINSFFGEQMHLNFFLTFKASKSFLWPLTAVLIILFITGAVFGPFHNVARYYWVKINLLSAISSVFLPVIPWSGQKSRTYHINGEYESVCILRAPRIGECYEFYLPWKKF